MNERAARQHPHALEQEGIVLSSVLARVPADALARVKTVLRGPRDFFSDANRWIYAAALALDAAGTHVDVTTVAAELEQEKRLSGVGGVRYLASLVAEQPASVYPEKNAAIIRNAAIRRRIIDLGLRLAAEPFGDVGALDEYVAQARSSLEDIGAAPNTHHVFDVKGADHVFAALATPAYVVTDLIRRSALALLGGYGSSGKTWQALDLAIAVANGTRWMGRFPCVQGRVLVIDYESGDYELRRRLQVLAAGLGLERVDGVDIATMPRGYLNTPAFLGELERLARGYSLVILDSLKAATPGADENAADMRTGLDAIRRVGETTGAAFLVLVHARKKPNGTGKPSDAREVLRGTSAIFDAADAVLVSDWDRGASAFRVSQIKARHGKAIEPFAVELKDDRGGVVLSSSADEPAPDASFEELCQQLRRAVRHRPDMGTVALRESVGGRAKRVDAAVEYLVNRGELQDLGGKTGHRYRMHEAAPT